MRDAPDDLVKLLADMSLERARGHERGDAKRMEQAELRIDGDVVGLAEVMDAGQPTGLCTNAGAAEQSPPRV